MLVRRQGWAISVTTVRQIPARRRVSGRCGSRRRWRPYARRKPWGYAARAPGDLVEIDATPITLYAGCRWIHVTARDVVSRNDVLAAYRTATSRNAERFVRHELPRMGVAIRTLQIDRESEFKAAFERTCQALGIYLFVLPPGSPKLNGHVERAHRTHPEEFCELVEAPDDLDAHNALLRAHEAVYNGIRPHHALGHLTPNEFLPQWQSTHPA